ncbi:Zinc finger, RING-type [Dillenia turbinata]|uniref:RING-type E3 ubiquitin transferase n=1 Tax=Dillenia turbinata TaxID=194707 RepID=A0AAN8V773_9MAGN
MATEADITETSSFLERLISSRNRDLSLFLPFIVGITAPPNPSESSTDPDEEYQNETTPSDQNRIILINPFTQGMIVIQGTGNLDSLLLDLSAKEGQPPASKSSIESLPKVKITEESDCECSICLEDFVVGEEAKELPCKHRFHCECIDKWLGIHGNCPVCRYKFEELGKKKERDEREIWVSLSFNGRRRGSGDSGSNPNPSNDDSTENANSSSADEVGNS